MTRANPCFTVLILTLTLMGCGGSGFQIVPVSGKVTLNGKPLPNAVVSFEPIGGAKELGPGSSAETDAEGRFSLTTIQGTRGAVVGKHRVLFSTLKKKDTDAAFVKPGDIQSPELVPEKYTKEALTFEVPKEGTTEANFDLVGKPPTPLDRIPINPPRRIESDR